MTSVPRRVSRLLAVLLLTLLLSTTPGPSVAAHADGRPQASAGFVGATGKYAGTLAFTIESITPSVVTTTSPNLLTVTGTVRNKSTMALTDLGYRWQRAKPLTHSAQISARLRAPGTTQEVIAGDWTPLGIDLAAGATDNYTLAVGITGPAPDSLNIQAPGLYPVSLYVSGAIDVDGVPTSAQLGELRFLLLVTGLPTVPNAKGTATAEFTTPARISILWPLTSRPHRGVREVFLDDDLATEIVGDGELSARLRTLEQAQLTAGTAVLTIDPLLLEELQAMSTGYRVMLPDTGQRPIIDAPATTAPATTTATGSADPVSGSAAASSDPDPSASTPVPTTQPPVPQPAPDTVEGTGGPAAIEFLTRLRALAATHPVLLLPYSNPDTMALTRAGRASQLPQLRQRSIDIAEQVLPGVRVLTDLAVPPEGLANEADLERYLAAGYRSVLLGAPSVTKQPGRPSIGSTTTKGGTLAVALDDSDVSDALDGVLLPEKARSPGQSLNRAIALLVSRAWSSGARPVVRLPDYVTSVAGLQDLASALRAMAQVGAIAPSITADGLPQSAANAPVWTIRDPKPAASLPLSYLQRLANAHSEIRTVGGAVGAVPNSPGAALMGDLEAALLPYTSVSLRGDQSSGEEVVGTILATTEYLREGVLIRPTVGSYTLASQDSPLVLTVQNTLPYPVQLKLRINTQTGLVTQVPDLIELAPASSQQVRIPAQVSRSGSFLAAAQLLAPDGQTWSVSSILPIQSSAYGTVTLVIIILAGAVLAAMVIWRIAQRWRQRQQRLARERDEALRPVSSPPAAGSITAMLAEDAEGDTAVERIADATVGPIQRSEAEEEQP